MATVDEIINNALIIANSQVVNANNAAQATINAANGFGFTPGTFLLNANVEAEEPDFYTPENSTLTYESHRDHLIALLSGELAGFFNTYYPLAADAFDEATDWMVNSITNGGTGISASVEAQIWQRGRDRALADSARAEAETLDEFSARGFTLPSGALSARLNAVRFDGMTKTGDVNRDTTIEAAKIEIDNIRFAVEQAVKSRIAAMSAATDYIRALMAGPETAARVALLNSDARARMISATADLYRARISRDEVVMRGRIARSSDYVASEGVRERAFNNRVTNQVNAAAAAAEQYGKSAQAALSSLNSLVASSQVGFAVSQSS